jgi:hypothetical protein
MWAQINLGKLWHIHCRLTCFYCWKASAHQLIDLIVEDHDFLLLEAFVD